MAALYPSNGIQSKHCRELQDPLRLEALLLQLTCPDTRLIQEGEAIMKKYVKQPTCVAGLLQQIQGSQHAQVRQLATMLLRRRIGPLWSKLDVSAKEGVKGHLIQCILREPDRNIRRNIACVMSVVARRLLAKNKWNELLNFIHQCSQSENEDQRELAFVVLSEMSEVLNRALGTHLGGLQSLYHNALQDKSRKVQVQALKATAALLGELVTEDAAPVFEHLVPGMLEVVRSCLQHGEEDVVSQVLDVFSELASTATSVIVPAIRPLIHLCLEVMRQDELQPSTRDVAGMVVIALAEEKPKSIAKQGLVSDIVATLLHMMAVSQDNAAGELLSTFGKGDHVEEEGEDDDDEPTGQDIAQRCLDAMALNVSKKHFYLPTMQLIEQGLSSTDANMRKAGTAALAVIVEGCQEQITKDLRNILARVFATARDPVVAVRECACFVLGQLAENCQPEILQYHEEILPVIFNLLEDATLSVQLTGCHVLENFCEHLDKEVLSPYLELLLLRLHHLLQTPKTQVQEAVIGAIAATATGAEDAFTPYLHQVASMMTQLLPVTDQRLLSMKGRAMDCMARIALAVGQEAFRPYIDVCLQAAVQCFQLDDLSLKEDAYLFLAQMANVMREGFAAHLPTLVPGICALLEEDDGHVVFLDEEGEEAQGIARLVDGADEEEDEVQQPRAAAVAAAQSISTGTTSADEDDEEDDGDGSPIYDVQTGMLDVKKAAAFCLGEAAQYTGAAFAPFIEPSLGQLKKLTGSFNSVLREEVASVLPHLLLSAREASPSVREWSKGDWTDILSAPTRAVCDSVLSMLLDLLEDDEQDVAAQSFVSLQAALEAVGPCLLAQAEVRERFMTLLLKVFKEGLVSQQSLEDEDEHPEDEKDESSRDLIEAACDLVGACANTLGSSFVPYLDQIIGPVADFTRGHRQEGHRQAAAGCLGEVTEGLGPDAKRYFIPLLPVLKLCLTDACIHVRRNTAWCVGLFCQAMGEEIQPYCMELLQALHPLLAAVQEASGPETVDNAASAVARMIMAVPQGVPLHAVLPFFLQALPLRADKTENEAVYMCLYQLLSMAHPELQPHINTLLGVYGRLLEKPADVQEDVMQRFVGPSLKILFQQPIYQQQASAALGYYSDSGRQLVAQLLQQ